MCFSSSVSRTSTSTPLSTFVKKVGMPTFAMESALFTLLTRTVSLKERQEGQTDTTVDSTSMKSIYSLLTGGPSGKTTERSKEDQTKKETPCRNKNVIGELKEVIFMWAVLRSIMCFLLGWIPFFEEQFCKNPVCNPFQKGNRDYTIERGDAFPESIVEEHRRAYTDFAEDFGFVGPAKIVYGYVPEGKDDVSIGYDTNKYLVQEGRRYDVYRRSIHEYSHMYQKAYSAVEYCDGAGNRYELTNNRGPRWWTEGSAIWLVEFYPVVKGVWLRYDLERQKEDCSDYTSMVFFYRMSVVHCTARCILLKNKIGQRPDVVVLSGQTYRYRL